MRKKQYWCPRGKTNKSRRQSLDGQGLIEFALVLPIILLLILGILEMTRLMIAWFGVHNAARAGVDYAISGEYNPEYCSDGICSSEKERERARIQSIHDAAYAGATMIYPALESEVDRDEAGYFNLQICPVDDLEYPNQGIDFDTHRCYPEESLGIQGTRIAIVVEFNHPFILPILNTTHPFLRITVHRETFS
jgi:hypothetical protein